MAAIIVEDADDRRMSARKRAQNASFGAAVGPKGYDFDEHAIAVHRRPSDVRRNEDIACQARF